MAHHVYRAADMGVWVLNCGNWYESPRAGFGIKVRRKKAAMNTDYLGSLLIKTQQ
jgi:hypothetical protein